MLLSELEFYDGRACFRRKDGFWVDVWLGEDDVYHIYLDPASEQLPPPSPAYSLGRWTYLDPIEAQAVLFELTKQVTEPTI